MPRSVKAVLVGYHGKQNFGDDLFRGVIARYLHDEWQVDCVRIILGVNGKPSASADDPVRFVWSRNFFPLLPQLRWLILFLVGLRADVIVFGGGSLFTQRSFRWMYLALRLLRLLRRNQVKIVAIGVSVGPVVHAAEPSLARALGSFDRVICRDQSSFDLVRRIAPGIRTQLACDLAFLAGDVLRDRGSSRSSSRLVLGISVTDRALTPSGFERFVEVLQDCLKQDPELEIVVLCACADGLDGDIVWSKKLKAQLQGSGRVSLCVYEDGSLPLFVQAISDCDVVLACRMHVGIAAAFCNRPTLQIAYHQKVTEFFAQNALRGVELVDSIDAAVIRLPEFLGLAKAPHVSARSNNAQLIQDKADLLAQSLRDLTALQFAETES